MLLESARHASHTGRWSIAAAGPFLVLEAKGRRIKITRSGRVSRSVADPFGVLKKILRENRVKETGNVMPFAGGAIGYAGYEAKNLIEPGLPQKAKDTLDLPDLYFMCFDRGIVWDHQKKETVIFAPDKKTAKDVEERVVSFPRQRALPVRQAGVAFKPERKRTVESSLTQAEFMKAVNAAKSFIKKGDIYQANLSRCLSFPIEEDPFEIYRRLRQINPSAFFGFLDAGHFQILSGSPERLLKLENGSLETRPIAGTRSRGKDERRDAALALDLLLSPKERAEHIMLVDLERNDLGRVAEYGSVRVDELMTLEDYSHVKHIVSNVRGRLKKGSDAVDAFKAFFPGGTITGAPKVRCMEIIDSLEPVARGPYTGSLGYFSFTGGMDFNIIIRSLVVKGGRGYLHTGAGIVADSIPKKEYEETDHKAEAVLQAVFGEHK